jgi:hypothetical protein
VGGKIVTVSTYVTEADRGERRLLHFVALLISTQTDIFTFRLLDFQGKLEC